MGETSVPVKKQVESSEIQIGFCKYCGQSYQLETSGMCSQEMLDGWASEKCDCSEAKEAREMKDQECKAAANINKMFGDRYYQQTAQILMAAVHPVAICAVDSVTVNVGNGVKATMKLRKKKILVQKTTTMTDTKES